MRGTSGVCALLLAAGEGRRYGRLKQLETLQGVSLVRRAAQATLDCGLDLTVVGGAEAAAVRAELEGLPLQFVHNADWLRGIGSSIARGVRALQQRQPDAAAVLILLADQALIGSEELRTMLRLHEAQPTRLIVADHGDAFGPPCLFPADCRAALAQLDGDAGARSVVAQHRDRLMRIAMPAAAFDVDTPDDLARIRTQLEKSSPP